MGSCEGGCAPHSSADDDRRYRSRKELEEWLGRDPIDRFKGVLVEGKLATEAELDAMAAEAEASVRDALEWAQAQPYATEHDALRHVYADPGAEV